MYRTSPVVTLMACLLLMSCENFVPALPDSESILAEPVPGLGPEQFERHVAGDEEFDRTFGSADGLGPIFVAQSCATCHNGDGKGHPIHGITRFGYSEGGKFDPLINLGGPQLQHNSIPGFKPEEIPDSANVSTVLIAPAVTGLGFLEALHDSTIINLADSADADGDGISGRVAWVDAPDYFKPGPEKVTRNGKYIGKFGRKATTVDIKHQAVVAYHDDIGITSDFNNDDLRNVQIGNSVSDDVPDPEVGTSVVDNVVFYLQTLKAPDRRSQNANNVIAGEILFTQIGCASCHIPGLKTGSSDIDVLSRKNIFPYTDMLLHDMGPELDDGYTEGDAKSYEWRTTPLWGIGLSADAQGGKEFFMHDGRATTLEQAIDLHGGEGSASRSAFQALSDTEKQNLIDFLRSL